MASTQDRVAVPSGPSAAWPLTLLAIFIAVFVALAIDPSYRQDWLLENVIVLVAVPVLVATYPRLRFSNGAYTALFVFLLFHEIGSHYTYAEVPYDRWWQDVFGYSLKDALGFERNHYDRLVHFLYGLLVMPAVVELLAARAGLRGIWRWLVPVFFVMGHSQLFELVEWWAAEVFGGDLGVAYLAIQGDEWDAQKDMALASLGGAITATWLWWRGKL